MKNIKLLLLFLTFITISCSKSDSPESPIILNNENLITSFKLTINNEIVSGNIDQNNKTITFNVVGADLNSLVPTVLYSNKAKLSPSENIAQNFNNNVTYKVVAENGNSNTYYVIINNRPLNSENKILKFSIILNNKTVEAIINEEKKLITFNSGILDKTALSPIVTISEKATISPNITEAKDFNNVITYTVTAENGNIATYKVIANPPKIYSIYTDTGVYSSTPTLLYTGAEIIINGEYIDPNNPNAKLYLTDGINNYSLQNLKSESYTNNDITNHKIYTIIPNNIPTNANYKLIYEANDLRYEYENNVDIISENTPNPVSINKSLYNYNDELIITGENLTNGIAIPSYGSIHIIQYGDSNNLTINNSKTELKVTLDRSSFFPAYFGLPQEERKITLIGPHWRAGRSIRAIFK